MKITYWSDYACPYCYIGKTRLKKAIETLISDDKFLVNEPIELTMRAFRLDPNAGDVPESDTVTRFAKKYRLSPMLAKHQIEKISLLGEREGLVFNYENTQFTNTLDAHRITKLAYSKGRDIAEKVIEALFAAYFSENKLLADRELLIKTGVEAGMDEDEIKSMLDSDEYTDYVLADEREAHARGVSGVPYFEINDTEQIYGAEQTAVFKRHLERILTGSNDTQKNPSEGHVCGPDGCMI